MAVGVPARPAVGAKVYQQGDFRPDVEGMRTIAVLLVLLYHGGLSLVPGGFVGVDVFFVISGFLITRMLVAELEYTGRISLLRFYARRAKRLLPPAALVLVASAALTLAFVTVTDWRVFGLDIVAAAAYIVNWRLADRSVDYLAEDVGASPVQHFWSLAVEEQFYIIWPVLLLIVAWLVRRNGWPVRHTMAYALAFIAIPSLIWSIQLTSASSSIAFFVTTTRLWELAAGAFVAIVSPRLMRLPRRFAAAGAWCGLTAVATAGLAIDTSVPWPGAAALLPVLGTVAVIACGPAARNSGPVIILGLAPLQWVGKLSYSLYLWHWPLLIAATAYFGDLSSMAGLAVTTLALFPAWLTFTTVENPVRRLPSLGRLPVVALGIGGILSITGAVAGAAVAWVAVSLDATRGNANDAAQGAQILGSSPADSPHGVPVDEVEWMTPSPLDARMDAPPAHGSGCQVPFNEAELVTCNYGDPQGNLTIALIGDSKAMQWFSALDQISDKHGWRLLTFIKSSCPFAAATLAFDDQLFTTCEQWNREALDQLASDPPDIIVTSQAASTALQDPDDPTSERSRPAMVEGLVTRWTELKSLGIEVIALADTPSPSFQVYECAAENLMELSNCSFERARAIHESAAPTQFEAAQTMDIHSIDITDAICPHERCSAVIGNVLVYRQGSHLTDTYIRTLTPYLEAALSDVIEELGLLN